MTIENVRANGQFGPGEVGLDKVAGRYLDQVPLPDAPAAGAFAAANARWTIAARSGTSGGDWTLTINFTTPDGVSHQVTTTAIPHNTNSAGLRSQIYTALATAMPNLSGASQITVDGTSLASTGWVITFSGNQLAGRPHGAITGDASDLTGGSGGIEVTQNEVGATVKPSAAVLFEQGAVTGDPTDPTTWARNPLLPSPSYAVARAFARSLVAEYGDQSVGARLMSLFGYRSRLDV